MRPTIPSSSQDKTRDSTGLTSIASQSSKHNPPASMDPAPPAYTAGDHVHKSGEKMAELGSNTEADAIVQPTEDAPGFAPESVLSRGLQVPTRSKYLTSGYIYPEILAKAGVSKEMWTTFSEELSTFAELSKTQWIVVLGASTATAVFGLNIVGIFIGIFAGMVGHDMRKKRERVNMAGSLATGSLTRCIQRWNETYFQKRGLAIRVDLPYEVEDLEDMDVASSKLFQQDPHGAGLSSADNPAAYKKFRKLAARDDKERRLSIAKARIVIIPLDKSLKQAKARGMDGADKESVTEAGSEFPADEVTLYGESRAWQPRDWYPDEPKP